MAAAVVLLGPPGAGKSTVGAELGRLGLRWRAWELVILEQWASRDAFVANKDEGLRLLHAEMEALMDLPGAAVVLETTGLADAPFLDRLAAERTVCTVRFDVTLKEALRRISARPAGRHLTDDLEASRAIWDEFYDVVAPHRWADLVIDTETTGPSASAAAIMGVLLPRRSD